MRLATPYSDIFVNISKPQQRTLHALARGGQITLERNERGDIVEVECWTREGWRLGDCTIEVFKALKRRRLIMSREGSTLITEDVCFLPERLGNCGDTVRNS